MTPRAVAPEELDALAALCLRSKAHWGYDAGFLKACRAELTITVADLATSVLAALGPVGMPLAVVQLDVRDGTADLLKIFVAPEAMAKGHGRTLFDWARAEAVRRGARRLVIEADPGAVPFYTRMGATAAGRAPSGSIPGRHLPRLVLDLAETPC